MNSNSGNEVYPTWSKDYVDIHGRDLRVMMADDGSIFVPFQEIRKSGFHIFPRTEFHFSRVGKTMILNEFRLYMLGAAKEFLIRNKIHSLNQEDILETIEKCREQLFKNDEINVQNSSKPSGTLGRTLLENPVEVNKEVLSVFQKNMQQVHNDVSYRNENHVRENEGRQTLRMPHNKDNYRHDSGSSGESNDIRKPRNSNYGQQNMRNGSAGSGNIAPNQQQGSYGGINRDQNQRNRPNSSFAPTAKFASKRDNDSRPVSENEESETFLRLSDCKVERIKLQKTPQKVKVVHIETNNDKHKYWVHLVDNEPKVLDILEKCQEAAVTSPGFVPKLGDICMTMSIEDDLWYRVVVQRLSPMIKVHFIDFGNDAVVAKVKKLPEELRSITAQAVRVTFTKQEGEPGRLLTVDDVVSVRHLKEYVDTTILVTEDPKGGDGGASRRTTSAQSHSGEELDPCFLVQIKYSTLLKDGEVVKIVAYDEGRFYLQNREHHVKLKEITAHIKDLPKQPLRTVQLNQLVVCRKEGEEQMCRAVVQNVDDGLVTVQFIDFRTTDSMSIKGLYGVSKATVSLPVALIESPAIKVGYGDDRLKAEAESLIEDVIGKKQKFTVSMKEKEFDLLVNGKSLSKMLFPPDLKLKSANEAETSSSSPSKSATEATVRPSIAAEPNVVPAEKVARKEVAAAATTLYDSMTAYEAPMGPGDYMVTAFKDAHDFTVTSTGDEESDMLTKCTAVEVGAGEGPYEPVETEMVLARFEGEWYRGAVLEKMENGKYQIIFVEYGNIIEVTKEDIRRFPEEYKKIPMLGLMCKMDVPETEAVNKRLEQLLKPENIYEIDFISFDTESVLYTVNIPKVYDILNKEGLL